MDLIFSFVESGGVEFVAPWTQILFTSGPPHIDRTSIKPVGTYAGTPWLNL